MKKKRFAIFGGTFDPWTPAHQCIVDTALKSRKFDRVIISPTIVDWHRAEKEKWLSDKQKVELIVASMDVAGWEGAVLNDVGDVVFCAKDPSMLDPDFTDEFIHDEDFDEELLYELPCAFLSLRDFKRRDMLSISEEQTEFVNERISRHRFIDTLIDLKLTHGADDEWSVIIGTDSIKMFESWSGYRDILNNAKIIGIDGRSGDKLNKEEFSFVSDWLDISNAKLENVSASKIREAYSCRETGFDEYLRKVKKSKF